MTITAASLVIQPELQALQEVAKERGWLFRQETEHEFVLGLGRGTEQFFLRVDLTDYRATPAAWHWYNPQTSALDQSQDTPRGGTFFHSSGVICAPWNRLAYKSVNSKGPHGDWDIRGNWVAHANTGGTRTLVAMALRIDHELQLNFAGRLA